MSPSDAARISHAPSVSISAGRPRIDWVDYAKGIGIFLVVLGHVWRGMAGDDLLKGPVLVRFVDNWIYAFHMPLFFFLSGLFANGAVKYKPSTFLVKRLKGVAYPYFVWILIAGALRSLVYSGPDATLSFLSSYWRVLYEPYDIFWFLYALFIISVAYYVLRRIGLSNLLVAALFLAAYLAFSLADVAFAWHPANNFCQYGLYFAGAAYFSERGWSDFLKSQSAALKVAVITVSMGLLAYLSYRELLVAGEPVIYAAGTGILAVVLASMILERRSTGDFIRRWGTLSLQIYVVHTIAGAATRLALLQIGVSEPIVHLLAGTMVGIYASILIYHAGNRIGFPYLFSLKS